MENTIAIETGNIIHLKQLLMTPTIHPEKELLDSLKYTVNKYKETNVIDFGNLPLEITGYAQKFKAIFENDYRGDLRVTIKVLVSDETHDHLDTILNKIFTTLQVNYIDMLICSFSTADLSKIREGYAKMEGYVINKRVKEIGVANVKEAMFIELFKAVSVKPSIFQMFSKFCCFAECGFKQFCDSNGVKILAHYDCLNILPNKDISDVIGGKCIVNYAARISIYHIGYAVLKGKGYLINLAKISEYV